MLRLNRPLLAAGLAASFLATAITLPADAQSAPKYIPQAGSQQQGATMDVNVFYDQLQQYGNWVQHPDYEFVFIPNNVAPGWRPYQEGRWVWTDQYGWYWESYEPFGWATYHYGRWGYDPAFGWYWVPGDTWSPAWVTWRKGGGRTGWAPVAPDRPGYAVGPPVQYAPPVAESWVFVEDQYMGEQDLSYYAAPVPEINIYLEAAPDYYEPVWNDGYYVNRGFGYDVYDGPVRDRLYSREVVYVDRQDDVFYDDQRLGIFAPAIALANGFRPQRYESRPDRLERAMIRQYVRDDRNIPGVFAPSAALLNVVDANRRSELRRARFEDAGRYQRELQQIQRQRADRLQEVRQQAFARQAGLERQRQQALEQRRAYVQQVQLQQRQRAQRVQAAAQGRPGMPVAVPGRMDQMQFQQRQRLQQEQLRAQQQQRPGGQMQDRQRAMQQQQMNQQQRQADQVRQLQERQRAQQEQIRAQQQRTQQAGEAQRAQQAQQRNAAQQAQQQRAAAQQAQRAQQAQQRNAAQAQQQKAQQQRAAAQQAQQRNAAQAQQQRAQQQRAAAQQAQQKQRAAAQQAQQRNAAQAQQQRAQQQRAAAQQAQRAQAQRAQIQRAQQAQPRPQAQQQRPPQNAQRKPVPPPGVPN